MTTKLNIDVENALNTLYNETSYNTDMLDENKSDGSIKYYKSKLKLLKKELEWLVDDVKLILENHTERQEVSEFESEEYENSDDDE